MKSIEWRRAGGFVGVLLMLVHAALSAYWAAGGTALLSLLSEGIVEMADERSASLVFMLWGVAAAKLIVAVTGIGLVRSWFGSSMRPVALAITWLTSIVLALYGAMQISIGLVMLIGLLGDQSSSDQAFIAYLLLWAPLWLAIGIGFSLLSWEESFHRPGPV